MKNITAFQFVQPKNINPNVLVYVYDEYNESNVLLRTGVRRSIQLDDITDAEVLTKIEAIRDFILSKENGGS